MKINFILLTFMLTLITIMVWGKKPEFQKVDLHNFIEPSALIKDDTLMSKDSLILINEGNQVKNSEEATLNPLNTGFEMHISENGDTLYYKETERMQIVINQKSK